MSGIESGFIAAGITVSVIASVSAPPGLDQRAGGVVDQQINLAEAGQRAIKRRADVFLRTQIELDGNDLACRELGQPQQLGKQRNIQFGPRESAR